MDTDGGGTRWAAGGVRVGDYKSTLILARLITSLHLSRSASSRLLPSAGDEPT